MHTSSMWPHAQETNKVETTTEMVESYWQHLAARQSWAGVHPGYGFMPIGLHGDDGRYNQMGDRVIIVTLNMILGRDSGRSWAARCSNMLIIMFKYNQMLWMCYSSIYRL